jgi:hypothetical protein
MVIIKFEKGQGLGNQLFNYASGLGISKALKYDLGIINFNLFKGKNFLNLKKFKKVSHEHAKNNFIEQRFYINQLNAYNYVFDNEIFKIKKKTLISGIFQDEKYFKNIKINKNIEFKKNIFTKISKKFFYIDFKNSCFLNIRGGEYKNTKELILPKSYWENSVLYFKKKKKKFFFIVTDDKKYSKKLFPDIPIVGDNIAECYYLLMKSNNIIISNSAFSYFPINNSPNKNIVAPLFWGRFNNNFKIWVSLSNIYKNYAYMNNTGSIIKKNELKKNLGYNLNFFKNYKIKTNLLDLDRPLIKKVIPKKILQIIRYLRYGLKDI